MFLRLSFGLLLIMRWSSWCRNFTDLNTIKTQPHIEPNQPTKPCYLIGDRPLPKRTKIPENVTCSYQDLVLSPIPNLVKDGVTLSSIISLSAPNSLQFHDALRRFVPRSRNITEDSRYLNTSLQLYHALSQACWSIGGKEFDAYRQLLKPLTALLEILIVRMNRDTKKIDHYLQKILETCGACSPQDKYEVILLAATGGIDPNIYIPKVKGLECKDLTECIQGAAKDQIFLAKSGSTVHSSRGLVSLSIRILLLSCVVSILVIV